MDHPVLADLFARVAALTAQGKRHLLGITGPPGAGKSTLAHRVVAHSPVRAVAVPMDGFHLANAELARLGRSDRKGACDTFDSAGYVALLRRLRFHDPAEIVYAPEFRREIEEPIAGAIPIFSEHKLIVTEGNYLLLESDRWALVRPLLDEVWYVDLDHELRLQRLIARHIAFGRDERAATEWVMRSDEANAALIATSRARADVIVTS